jgi:hypothetical protein
VLTAASAHGAQIVTACGTDNAAGGLNLRSAVAAGGDIVVRCAGGAAAIQMTATLVVRNDTTIDGEAHLTIRGTGDGAMFALDGPRILSFKRLTLRNPPNPPGDPNRFTGIVYDSADKDTVVLDGVTVSDTRLPFVVRRFVARQSTFIGNGDAANPDIGVVMAGDLELRGTTFRNNSSRPFAVTWRGDVHRPGHPMIARVIDSTFERNARPSVWGIGPIHIFNSRFLENGAAAPFASAPAGGLYGGAIYLEFDPSVGGALDIIRARATISRSTFRNNRGMAGGAVFSALGHLTVESSEFDGNRATVGGAIAFAATGPSRLTFGHVKLYDNAATTKGGALAALGTVEGDAVLLSGNSGGASGGAIALGNFSAALPAPIQTIVPPVGFPSSLALSRAFFLDNKAPTGAAIDAGAGTLSLGNTLVARNISGAPGGAIIGSDVELANTTVIANRGIGIFLMPQPAAKGLRFANSIVASNDGGNCRGSAPIAAFGPNLQFPGNECGAGAMQGDPQLVSRFKPGSSSPARDVAAVAICLNHELVQGRDLYGHSRQGAECDIGAVEADIEQDVLSTLPFGIGKGATLTDLLCYLLWFSLLMFILGMIFYWLRRRRRRKPDHE